MTCQNKQQKIIKAVEELFRTKSIHTITTDDIAREARVGKGTIYRYFNDKEDLFFQTAISGFDELCDLLIHKIPENISFIEQLICACREIRAFFNKRRQIFNIDEQRMFWHKKSILERWKEKRKKLVSIIAGIIDKGVKKGAVRSDIPAEILAYILLAMLRTQTKEFLEYTYATHKPEFIVDLFIKGAEI